MFIYVLHNPLFKGEVRTIISSFPLSSSQYESFNVDNWKIRTLSLVHDLIKYHLGKENQS